MKSREELEAERVYGWARPEVVAAALAEARAELERSDARLKTPMSTNAEDRSVAGPGEAATHVDAGRRRP